jgi:2'-5' RNA ligase
MIKLLDLLKENSTSTYDYGCVMLYFNFPQINKIHDAIDPKDIYSESEDKTFGLEDEPHTTLLYGLHEEVSLDDIKQVLNEFVYDKCIVHTPSLFENEKYDVLKFDVKGNNLHETNASLKQFPFTSNFPNYHPHLTIGYLKPGTGKRYVEMLNKAKANKYELIPQYAVYSQPDGIKNQINIKVKK